MTTRKTPNPIALALALAALLLSGFLARAGEDAPTFTPNLSSLFGGGSSQEQSRGQLGVDALRALLSKERNVIIEEQDGMLIVDGRVSSKSAQNRLAKILERYDNILDLTEFIQDEEAILARADYLKKKIETRLNRDYDPEKAFVPMQTVEYEIVENEVVIVGELNNKEDVDRVIGIIATYESGDDPDVPRPAGGQPGGMGKIGRHLSVRKLPLEISIIFAKIREYDLKALGISGLTSAVVTIPKINFQSDNGPPSGNPLRVFNNHRWSAGEGSLSFGNKGEIGVDFKALDNNNLILSKPHLSALNGTPARFHSGGQRGYAISNNNIAQVDWKDFGTILSATPTLTTDGRIHLKLRVEFSTPSGEYEYTRMEHESEAIVSSDQGMVLSGMVQNIRSSANEGSPGLRRIPILGYFFGHRNKTYENEELMILAIPRYPDTIDDYSPVQNDRSSRVINGVIEQIRPGDAPAAGYSTFDQAPPVHVGVWPVEVTRDNVVVPAPGMQQAAPADPADIHNDLKKDLVAF